jgi:hypothetical protein
MTDNTLPPFLTAVLFVTISALGLMNRHLDKRIPKNDLDERKRARAINFISYGALRSIMLCLDLYNSIEFFKNWYTPLQVSQSYHHLNLYVSGLYCSMLVYEMASFECGPISLVHHVCALIGNSLPLMGVPIPQLYPFFVFVYRLGTLLATPVAFCLSYYYLGPNKKPSLKKKLKVMTFALWAFRITLNMANIVSLGYYFTHFWSLPIVLRVVILALQCGFVPEQIATAKTIAMWNRKLVTQIKTIASPVTPIMTEFKHRLSSVSAPVAELKRRISVSSPVRELKRRFSASASITPMRTNTLMPTIAESAPAARARSAPIKPLGGLPRLDMSKIDRDSMCSLVSPASAA